MAHMELILATPTVPGVPTLHIVTILTVPGVHIVPLALVLEGLIQTLIRLVAL
jgi:hypothetical protein